MQEIIEYSQGNPGALNFLLTVFSNPKGNIDQKAAILIRLRACPTLRGTNLYVLYSDLCDKDIEKVVKLCTYCPNDILEDACSRQDYSGRELVAVYLENPSNVISKTT